MSLTGTPRVLHVVPSLSTVHGGTTTTILRMMEALLAEGVACEVALSDDNGRGKRLPRKASERALYERHYFAKVLDFYTFTPALTAWLLKHQDCYDLAHIHGLFSHVNGAAGRACRRIGLPYIVTPHGMANIYGMRRNRLGKMLSFFFIERKLLNGAATIHVTSTLEQQDLESLKLSSPVMRIPLGVSPIPLGNASRFLAPKLDNERRQVAVFVGRLNPVKNLENAIAALGVAACGDWHLIVAGDGPRDYVGKLKDQAVDQGVSDRISWVGFINHKELPDLLAVGDVFLLPSLSESFGAAAVEAVSAGLPCVLGENVGVAQELAAAGFAVTVPPTRDGVARGLRDAVALKGGTASFAACARRFVEEAFSPLETARRMVGLYRQVLTTTATQKHQQH